MPTPPHSPTRRIRIITRSGRVVRPPVRYEPDSDVTLEDDYSDTDDEWGLTDESQGDASDGSSSSYASTLEMSDSEEEEEDEDKDQEDESEEDEPCEDVIEWETLTADVSDDPSSLSENEHDDLEE